MAVRALVTGANGFIGSHLTRHLVATGADVVAAFRPGSDTWRIDDLLDDVDVLPFELGATTTGLERRLEGLDVLYHLAAAGVTPGRDRFEQAIENNVMGTLRLLELASAVGVGRVVNCGSCFEYGSGSNLSENELPRPTSDYAASKSAAWILAHSLAHRTGLPVVSVRPFTVYGPGEAAYRLIPSIILAVLGNRPVELTEGEQTRDFLFVADAVAGLVAAGSSADAVGSTFNLCTGIETSVRELAELAVETIGAGELRLGALPYREDELWRLSGDPTAARIGLGWSADTPLRQGLEQTAAWFRDHASAHSTYEAVRP
jgi:nucleoside-diphosphate-sugar epimerase